MPEGKEIPHLPK
jgi:hypothetical protein